MDSVTKFCKCTNIKGNKLLVRGFSLQLLVESPSWFQLLRLSTNLLLGFIVYHCEFHFSVPQ